MLNALREGLRAAVVLGALAAVAAEPARVSVTGEVIDSACYIKSGARGESHRVCAQKCSDAGIPLAIAGRRVTVEGTWAERGGAKILLLHSVKAAPAS
jgi:hypothetical protein